MSEATDESDACRHMKGRRHATCHAHALSTAVTARSVGRCGPKKPLNPAQPTDAVLRSSCTRQHELLRAPMTLHHASPCAVLSSCRRSQCSASARWFISQGACVTAYATVIIAATLDTKLAAKPGDQSKCASPLAMLIAAIPVHVRKNVARW